MTILFIADLHLSNDEPAITAGFLNFLKTDAIHASALYILGDLFEVWIGDDDRNPLHQAVADALNELHQYGVPSYFIHGNRDFLLGKQFAQRSKLTLLPEQKIVDIYGKNTLILHGDTLCTDDVDYLKFRKRVHNPILRRIFLWLPLSWRQKIALQLRNESKKANQAKSMTIMDVNQATVAQTFAANQVHYMVHGHTHRPAIHTQQANGETNIRFVLGAWHEEGSVLRFYDNGEYELVSFPL